MLLPKSTLEQIECYEITQAKVLGEWQSMDDVIILHFKQWWKPDKTLTIRRLTTNIDNETQSFSHEHSAHAIMLLQQLADYMDSTFPDGEQPQTDATILSIVPRLNDES